MHKDALADGAKKALDEIFGPLESSADDEDDQNEAKKNDDGSSGNSLAYLGFMGVLFLPGLMIGCYLGSRGRGGQDSGEGKYKDEKKVDISRSTSTNVIHQRNDVERS